MPLLLLTVCMLCCRVHTGFEWNKYNQTHYDMDNPPPKIVQGYKFNIFYPDLIDKNTTPEYFLVSYSIVQGYTFLAYSIQISFRRKTTPEYFVLNYKMVQCYKLGIFYPDLINKYTVPDYLPVSSRILTLNLQRTS